jgi:hypothetical protein
MAEDAGKDDWKRTSAGPGVIYQALEPSGLVLADACLPDLAVSWRVFGPPDNPECNRNVS